jgi:hypothetical protein
MLGVRRLRSAQSDGRHQLVNARVLWPTEQQRLGDIVSLCVCTVGQRLQSFREATYAIIYPRHTALRNIRLEYLGA